MLITIARVCWVITEQVPGSSQATDHKILVIEPALLRAVRQTTGVLLSSAAILYANMSLMRSAFIRLVGGTFVVLFVIPI